MKLTGSRRIGLIATALVASVAVTGTIAASVLGSHGSGTNTAASSGLLSDSRVEASAAGLDTDALIQRAQARVKQSPNDANAYALLGEAYLTKAQTTGDTRYLAQADTTLQQALKLAPKNDAAVADTAWLALLRHDYTGAATAAQQAITLRANNDRAYGFLGDAQIGLGTYDAAEASYQKMNDLKPSAAAYQRASALRRLNGDDHNSNALIIMAMNAARTGGAPAAELAGYQVAQADNYFSQGFIVPAQSAYQAALSTLPNDPAALAGLARTKAALGDPSGAMETYLQAITLAPSVPQYAIALGDLYAVKGRAADAKKLYDQVDAVENRLIANHVDVALDLAYFHADHDQDLAGALKIAKKYATTANIYAQDEVAWIYYKNGNYADALAMEDQAVRLHTHTALFYYHEGMMLKKLGRLDEALSWLNNAVMVNAHFDTRNAPIAVATIRDLGSHPLSSTDKNVVNTQPGGGNWSGQRP